jgi:hypothetical protein
MGKMMVHVYKLTKRHLDGPKSENTVANQIKIFSTCIGHGVGTIDFSEKVLEMDEAAFEEIVRHGGEYAGFKLGNLSKYFEIEIFPEHAAKLLPQLPVSSFKTLLEDLREGYLVLRKDMA